MLVLDPVDLKYFSSTPRPPQTASQHQTLAKKSHKNWESCDIFSRMYSTHQCHSKLRTHLKIWNQNQDFNTTNFQAPPPWNLWLPGTHIFQPGGLWTRGYQLHWAGTTGRRWVAGGLFCTTIWMMQKMFQHAHQRCWIIDAHAEREMFTRTSTSEQ